MYACPMFREVMELDLNLLWVNWAHTNQHLGMEAAHFLSVNSCQEMRYHNTKRLYAL